MDHSVIETNNVTAPSPMEGDGAYNRNSGVQAAGSLHAVSLFENAAQVVDLEEGSHPILIADYGSSQGRNSFGPMSAAILSLRKRTDEERAISVVHTDLPGNDFSELFRTLNTDERSYIRAHPGTFASAVGRSFYEQILPSESVTLGWSSWAVQWLSRTPCPIPDHVQVAYSQDQDTETAYARQSAEDWRTFLLHRAAELRPGGRLVVLTMGLTDDGEYGYRPLLDAMYSSLMQMVDEGHLRQEELRQMAVPTVSRSLADLTSPFDGEVFAGLSVEHVNVFLGHDSIWEKYQNDRDPHAFGAQWAAFSRASVLPTLAAALLGNDDNRTKYFLDQVEAGMANRLATNPQIMQIPLGVISLVKKTPGH